MLSTMIPTIASRADTAAPLPLRQVRVQSSLPYNSDSKCHPLLEMRYCVADREASGTAGQGAEQAALHVSGAGRGVRGVEAHHFAGHDRPCRHGRSLALYFGAGWRVLAAAGWQAALPLVDGGRGVGFDRLLRGTAPLPGL